MSSPLVQRVLQESGTVALLGNEAIVRGALEAGVQYVSTYPGTPASEIGDTFFAIQDSERHIDELYFEYATNEKVALESAIGASYSGLRTLVAMKHFGVNVCTDALMPFVYTGSRGPTVIVVGDDPSCWSSGQSEQNTRGYADLAHIPILEPADPAEAHEYVQRAFELSETHGVPVMVRITTRISHQRQTIPLSDITVTRPDSHFVRDPQQYITMPPRVLGMKEELFEKLDTIREEAEQSELNTELFSDVKSDIGIITSSVASMHVREALSVLGMSVPVLKLGYFYPLPTELLEKFMQRFKRVFIVEELEPHLENDVTTLAKRVNPKLSVYGKELLSDSKEALGKEKPAYIEELRPEYIAHALSQVTDHTFELDMPPSLDMEGRTPRFCNGCPYWAIFGALDTALEQSHMTKDDVVFGGDIGCYMMAGLLAEPKQDYLLNMGASVGVGHGIAQSHDQSGAPQKMIATIGDSTFFHSGMTALVNVVYNQSAPLIIIFDNRITAMTGHQPNPGMEKTGMGTAAPLIRIEDVVEAFGIEDVAVIDPVTSFEDLVGTMSAFLKKNTATVIVAKRICKLWEKQRAAKDEVPRKIDSDNE